MNDREVIYWLRGFFDIDAQANRERKHDPNGGFGAWLIDPLNYQQIQQIKAKTNWAREKRITFTKASLFVEWLSGTIESFDFISKEDNRRKLTKKIIEKLYDEKILDEDTAFFNAYTFDASYPLSCGLEPFKSKEAQENYFCKPFLTC